MKSTPFSLSRIRRVAAMAVLSLLAFPALAAAKPKSEGKHKKSRSSHHEETYDRHRDDPVRRHYHAYPRSGFTFTFGTGYAGRGYYYGPPGASYYYERPDVRYYRDRRDVPGYDSGPGYHGSASEAAVQRALYRLGYYRGPIDGNIGPGSRRAIVRFEVDHGLPPRGYVSVPLLRALRLR